MNDPDSISSSAADARVRNELEKAANGADHRTSPGLDKRSDDVPGPVADADCTVLSSQPPFSVQHDYHGLPPAELGTVLEGRRLGHFRLDQFVGGGGMGAVFRGFDTELNRTVAVKVLYADPSAEEDVERRFRNEAQSAARLDHDNIARVFFVGEDQGVHYIVFEYIDGINIRDLVAQGGPLPLADVVNFTLQIAGALAHASRRDVVHRDIKPSNVLITADGRAKLVDMGLARLHQVECTERDLTASGVTLGTFDYISPEQARDPRSADVRSDIYSLGCTFFFMLTGQPPFPKGTVLQKLLKHQGDSAPDPRSFRPELPDDVSVVAGRMLAKSPIDRYQDPESLIGELLSLARRLGLPAAAPGSTVWVATGREESSLLRRHLPWITPTVLLVISVIVLDRIWFRAGTEMDVPERPEVVGTDRVTAAAGADRRTAEAGAETSAALPEPPVTGSVDSGSPGLSPLPSTETSADDRDPSVVAATEPDHKASHSGAGRVGPANADGFGSESPSAPADGDAPTEQPARADPPTATAPDRGSEGVSESHTERSISEVAGAESGPDRVGTVVVAPAQVAGDASVYSTLRAAAGAARSGDVIELRFSGRQDVQPLRLANKRLTIRAGKGFSPHLVLRPDPDGIYPVRHGHSMLTLLGGDLTLVGVHLELHVPRGTAMEGLSMFETRGTESVRIERCWLTVFNEARCPGVAFFRANAAPGGDALLKSPPREEKPVRIRIEHCIARGDATFLASAEMQPVDLSWKNGLLVTGERLLELQGGGMRADGSGALQVDLQHVTAHVGRGLLLAANVDAAALPVRIVCSDSIVLAAEDAVLFESYGTGRSEQLDNLLVWQGDRNFYEGFHVFGLTRGGPDDPQQQMGFAEWQERWSVPSEGHENLPRYESVVWKALPLPDRPTHEQTAEDYGLSDRVENNPAHGGASDGSDVGFLEDAWPVDAAPGQSDPAPAKEP